MENSNLIRKYLHAELTEDERKKFDHLRNTDKVFDEEFKFHSLMHKHRIQQFKSFVSKSEKSSIAPTEEVKSERINNSTPIFKILRNIAAIFIIAAISYVSFNSLNNNNNNNNNNNDPKLLVDSYLNEPYMSPGTLQSAEGDKDAWQSAITHYGKDEFELAEKEILNIDSISIEQQLYLGLSKLYKTNPAIEESISILESIKDRPDNFHEDATNWYLALAYLKNGQHESAKPIIKMIANGDHFKSKDAIKLLQQFNKI